MNAWLCVALCCVVQQDAVQREWRARALAQTAAHQPELLVQNLQQGDWRDLCGGFQALARPGGSAWNGALDRPELRALLLQACQHEHPNVRAAALQALAQGTWAPVFEPAQGWLLARDPLPAVREALARALALPSPCSDALGQEMLLELLLDRDRGVSAAALHALFETLQPDSAWLAAEAARRAASWPAALELSRALLSAAPLPQQVAPLRARLAGSEEPAAGALQALVEALAAAQSLECDQELLRSRWRSMFSSTEDEPRAMAEMLRIWCASGSRALARNFLLAAQALPVQEQELADVWLEGVCFALGVPEALDQASTLELATCTSVRLLAVSGQHLRPHEAAALVPWVQAHRPLEVREVVLRAASEALLAHGDAESGAVLARLLLDQQPRLRLDALRALGSAASPKDYALPIAEAFLREDPLTRAAWVPLLPRDVPLPGCAALLIELGSQGGDARRSAVELLAASNSDVQVEGALLAWLAGDWEAVCREQPADRRAPALLVQGELRALSGCSSPAVLEALSQLLPQTRGRSSEVGKVLAAVLGLQPEQPEVHSALLAELEPGADLRTRIECACVLARSASASSRLAAVRCLIEDGPRAGSDLRPRMLQALGASGERLAADYLRELALGAPGLAAEERSLAVEALAMHRSRSELDSELVRIARAHLDFETRNAALRALAERPSPQNLEALLLLREYWCSATGPERPEEVELCAALLPALGANPLAPADVARAVFTLPLVQASQRLEAYFTSAQQASGGFAWNRELELARVLMDRAGFAPALEQEWWRCDSQLLLSLGSLACGARDPSAPRLLSAGLDALLGEGRKDPGLERIAWQQLLAEVSQGTDGALQARVADGYLAQLDRYRLPESEWQLSSGLQRLPTAVLRWQGRAKSLLQQGQREGAKQMAEHAQRACWGVRAPAATRAAQQQLERQLAAH